MANPRLEKHILVISTVVFFIGTLILLIWNLGKLYSILGLLTGFVLSIANFLFTSLLYGNLGKRGGNSHKALYAVPVILSFIITLLALFLAYRFSHLFFWCAVAGVLMVPLATILFILAEATGIIHTDYYV